MSNMKKCIRTFIAGIMLAVAGWIPAASQDLPEILWDKTIGGNFADHVGRIYPAPDGGWLLFGTSSSNAVFEKSAAPYTMFGNDIWIVKYNSDWEKQWDKVIGGTDEESLSNVERTPDGNFLIGATSRSNASGDKSEDARSQDMEDYWLIKVDPEGNKIWDRTYGGADIDNLNSIRRHPQGGYLLIGTSYSGKSGDKTHDSFGKQDWWVLRIDEEGTVMWDKVFGGERFDLASGIFDLHDGFILNGKSDSPPSGNRTAEIRGSYDAWLVRIDFDGNKIWDKAFGGDENEGSASISRTHSDGYMLSITSKSSVSGDKTTPDVGGEDAWFVRVDSDFNILWDKTIGTVHQDNLSASRAGGGGYILTGTHTIEDAQPGGGIINYGQRWMKHTDDQLNEIWDFKFGGDKNETGGGSWRLESDTTIILVGSSSDSNISGDKSEDSRGGPDFWLTMIQMPFGMYTGGEGPAEVEELTLYPNPVNGNILYVETGGRSIRNIEIYSMTGSLVHTLLRVNHYSKGVRVGHLSPGLYISRVTLTDNSVLSRKFLRK
jgi:hypothetical protein